VDISLSLGTEGGTLFVEREPGDPRARASGFTRGVHGWGAEINLLYRLMRRLNACGFNLASVKVADDGHLYGDDHMRYLRTPKKALRKSDVPYPYIYIIDAEYMLRSAAEHYNRGEGVRFRIHGNVFGDYQQHDWCRKVEALCEQHDIPCDSHGPTGMKRLFPIPD
jgi:hypothetical protein